MMRSVEEQQAVVRGLARLMPTEILPLAAAEGRVLAVDVTARVAVPPFTNSSMDGYAVRAADVTTVPVVLDVVADVPAGATEIPRIDAGQAARTMTGAPLAEGADLIIPVENTDQPRGQAPLPQQVEIRDAGTAGSFVRPLGQNTQPGDAVLSAGAVLTPAALSSLASTGHAEAEVFVRPRVAVISTGDELVAPGQPLEPGQIPDSNGFLVAGLARRFGAEVIATRRATDETDEFRRIFREVAADADVVVTTGGVSVGAFDVVRSVLTEAEFTPVAMQPGKPQACGRLEIDGRSVAFLGLPGNPVSVFVSSWVFLRELLGAMTGCAIPWRQLEFEALEDWQCPSNRRQYIPLVIEEHGVRPAHVQGSGSHLVASLVRAQAIGVVPADTERVQAGDRIAVHLVE